MQTDINATNLKAPRERNRLKGKTTTTYYYY